MSDHAIVRVPDWGFSIGGARFHGWRWCVHIGPWLIFWGRMTEAQLRQSDNTPAKTDYRAALDYQAKMAVERAQAGARSDAEFLWLDAAARRIIELWPGTEYDTAKFWMRQYLSDCGMTFGDPDYIWTMATAREFAEEYVSEVGETLRNA